MSSIRSNTDGYRVNGLYPMNEMELNKTITFTLMDNLFINYLYDVLRCLKMT